MGRGSKKNKTHEQQIAAYNAIHLLPPPAEYTDERGITHKFVRCAPIDVEQNGWAPGRNRQRPPA